MKAVAEIAKREIQDNLATWKLPLAFCLTTLLLAASVLSVTASHHDAVDAYNLVQDEYMADERENAPEALAHRFLGRPVPLALLVGGPGEALRSAVANAPVSSGEAADLRQDPIHLRFVAADIGVVGVFVLSLLAILVSYDAVAGEKERGTLKLLLVNPLARSDVLLGKYLGAMLTLVLPLAAGVIAAIVLLTITGIRLSAQEYSRLLVILLVTVLFLSILVALSIAVSAMTTRSSVAILALSVAWLLIASGAGSLAAFAATAKSDGRGADDVLQELQLLYAYYDDEASRLRSELQALNQKNQTQNGTLSPADHARMAGLQRDLDSLPSLLKEDQHALLRAYVQGRELDLKRAEKFAAISPAEAFRSAIQKLARTDYDAASDRIDEFSRYVEEVERFRQEHLDSGGTNETFTPPAFRNQAHSIGSDIARASPFLLALIGQNLLVGAVGALAFSRYDVR